MAGPARAGSAGQQAAPSATTKVDDSTLKSRIAANLKKNATMAAREVDVDGVGRHRDAEGRGAYGG